MNFKNRIDELNTNLVLKETIIIMLIDDLKKTAIKTDLCLRFKVNIGKGIFDKGYHNIRNNFLIGTNVSPNRKH